MSDSAGMASRRHARAAVVLGSATVLAVGGLGAPSAGAAWSVGDAGSGSAKAATMPAVSGLTVGSSCTFTAGKNGSNPTPDTVTVALSWTRNATFGSQSGDRSGTSMAAISATAVSTTDAIIGQGKNSSVPYTWTITTSQGNWSVSTPTTKTVSVSNGGGCTVA